MLAERALEPNEVNQLKANRNADLSRRPIQILQEPKKKEFFR